MLRDDQSIKNLKNADPLDLARAAKASASAEHEVSPAANVLDGFTRAIPGGPTHRWAADMKADGPWIELSWDAPQALRRIQITFDSGFTRELTLTKQDAINNGIIRAPQPETVRDYTLSYRATPDGPWVELAHVDGNHQRVNRLTFPAFNARSLRLHVRATNGDKSARVFEIRCYA